NKCAWQGRRRATKRDEPVPCALTEIEVARRLLLKPHTVVLRRLLEELRGLVEHVVVGLGLGLRCRLRGERRLGVAGVEEVARHARVTGLRGLLSALPERRRLLWLPGRGRGRALGRCVALRCELVGTLAQAATP